MYDEQPLNKGTFVRVKNGKPVIDGIRPLLSLEDLENSSDMAKLMRESVTYISEAKEYFISDVEGNLCLNAVTTFNECGGNSVSVAKELSNVRKQLRRCYECIIQDRVCSLEQDNNVMACTSCRYDGITCVSILVVYTFSGMAPSQRVAHIDLNNDNIQYTQEGQGQLLSKYGFSFLHICKAFVSYMRNWWLTDNTGVCNIALLCSLLTSNDQSQPIDRKILNYRDRHSDYVACTTVNEDVINLLADAELVTATLFPDPFRPWSTESQSHVELKAFTPYYI